MSDDKLTGREIEEFAAYLQHCSNAQVQGVYDKEKAAGREGYAALAVLEARVRGIDLEV